jgi:hypothetical protein
MDDQNSKIVPALKLTKEGEELGDISGIVLIATVQPHQRVEQKQSGPDPFNGFVESHPIALEIET